MSWSSFHLFYHGDRDRLLLDLVRPLAAEAFASGLIDRMFFIRYSLGGPHVRLRLRSVPGREPEVSGAVESAAAAFFARQPSTTPKDEEEIRSTNRKLLASDPNETDDSVHPDNSFRVFPFQPETGRYGGPSLLAHSLEFFCVSSLRCLDLLARHAGEPWSRRSPHVLRLLARLALGFSRDLTELQALLSYPSITWGEPMEPITLEGDRIFERNREAFCRLLRTEVQAFESPQGPSEAEEARALAWEIGEAPLPVRRMVLTSHLHMTANRLGLSNPEEVYLVRILWRAVGALADTEAGFGDALSARLADRAGAPPPARLEDIAARPCFL